MSDALLKLHDEMLGLLLRSIAVGMMSQPTFHPEKEGREFKAQAARMRDLFDRIVKQATEEAAPKPPPTANGIPKSMPPLAQPRK